MRQAELPDLVPDKLIGRRWHGSTPADDDLQPQMREIVAQRVPLDIARPLGQAPEAAPDASLGAPHQGDALGRAIEQQFYAAQRALPRRAWRGDRLDVAGESGLTVGSDRTPTAIGPTPVADGSAEVHKGLRVSGSSTRRRIGWRETGLGLCPKTSRHRWIAWPAGDERVSRHHATHIAVEDRSRTVEGQRHDRRGSRAPYSRQRHQALQVVREAAACRNQGRGAVQVAGPAVISEPGPQTHDVIQGCRGERRDVGEMLYKTHEGRQHGGDLRLLKHHLRQPHTVGVAGILPRQAMSSGNPLPVVQADDKVVCSWQLGFAERLSCGNFAPMTDLRARISANRRHNLWRGGIGTVLAATGCLMVFTAFGVAPPSSLDLQSLRTVDAPDGFSLETVSFEDENAFRFSPVVRRGDTMGDVLSRAGVSAADIARLMAESSTRRVLGSLKPGQAIEVGVDAEGALQKLAFNGASGDRVEIDSVGDGFTVRTSESDLQTVPRFASGEIRSSLFAATDDAGIPDAVAVQLAEIFSGVVDFHRGLRKGDRFWLVYEQNLRNGEAASSGRVIAAEFSNGDATHSAYWFEPRGQRGAYYTADGKSLRRQFLMSPLEFSRVTSGFSAARFHPVLQEWRAHRGVDYGAPSGARVRATADGVVEAAGYSGGYGNLVVIAHGNSYSTAYGHLSGFGPGVRRGARIGQGDTLGYVCATGLATGPHLHYEFRVKGTQIDPQTVRMAEAAPLTGESRHAFEQQRSIALRHIGFAKQTVVARFE